jgi:hypothetical protein
MGFDPNAYLAANANASEKSTGFDPKAYLAANSEKPKSWLDTKLPFDTTPRGFIQGGLDALPMVGAGVGGAGGAVVGAPAGPIGAGAGAVTGAAAGGVAGQNLKDLGEQYILGKDAPTRDKFYSDLGDAARTGAQQEMGGQVFGTLGDSFAKSGLRPLAEDAAVNATGATGLQASKFADVAGRELLDRNLVKFGDSQSKIAQRVSGAMNQANGQIDSALAKLDAAGVKVDGDAIKKKIADKLVEMKKDPSQFDIVRTLESEIGNIQSAIDAKGTSQFGMQEAENIKRGYNRKAGDWQNQEKQQAGKSMYQTFRGGVEDAAQAADPTTAGVFQEGKKVYGLLSPIDEAASRRANVTNQSPAGGLMDVVAAGVGHSSGVPGAGFLTPIARRVVSPRISSSVAAGSDGLANLLMKSPEFSGLAQSNPSAFQALSGRLSSQMGDRGSSSAAAAMRGPDQPTSYSAQKEEAHYDPSAERQQSPEEAKAKFLSGN